MDTIIHTLIKISFGCIPQGSITDASVLVQVIWPHEGDKPLTWPMMTHSTDAFMHHLAWVSWHGFECFSCFYWKMLSWTCMLIIFEIFFRRKNDNESLGFWLTTKTLWVWCNNFSMWLKYCVLFMKCHPFNYDCLLGHIQTTLALKTTLALTHTSNQIINTSLDMGKPI